jgi:hypothetical protein
MDRKTAAMLKVIVDGQAYLYAMFNARPNAEDEELEALMMEWKTETASLIGELLEQEQTDPVL